MLINMKSTLLLLTSGIILHSVHTQECRLWMSKAPEFPALLIRSRGRGLLHPDIVSTLPKKTEEPLRAYDIPEGETLTAACPGTRNYLKATQTVTAKVTCYRGRLKVNRKNGGWQALSCAKRPRPNMRSKGQCINHNALQQIGWQISSRVFVPQLDICFDKERETTVYTHHQLHGRYIDAKTIDPPRPAFKTFSTGGMFSSHVKKEYKKLQQILTFEHLLGSLNHLNSYFTRENYLARGHLAPDSDFVTAAEQDATYYYINVVPQWQKFNNGNWKELEQSVRELAERLGADLDIWTGSHGVLQLPDENQNFIDMYLEYPTTNQQLPVPSMMWKAIYNPATEEAAVIIGLNSIEEDSLENARRKSLSSRRSSRWSSRRSSRRSSKGRQPSWPCPDLCHQLSWASWEIGRTTRGQMFCCSIESAREIIPTIPDLGSVSLLTG